MGNIVRSGWLVLVLAGCASGGGDPFDLLTAKLLSPEAQARVDLAPLGSPENPVRADGVEGQHRYLSSLVCADGKPPAFERRGSVGVLSPYGTMMDIYELACELPPSTMVHMDLYHPGHVEGRPVRGFTMTRDDER